MTLLENRTYGWTSWSYASFTQSITYRSGTNPPKTRNTSSCQSSSSESITEMNYPDVRIPTIRRYAWTSWPRPVSGGPKLLVPSPQGAYSISVHTKMSCNISMTYTSFDHAYGAPSVSFIQPWHGVSKTFFKIIRVFSFTGINTMLVHMFSRQTSLRFDCCPKKQKKQNKNKKNVETKTLARQTNYPCNSCTDHVNDRDGYTTCLCKVSSFNL